MKYKVYIWINQAENEHSDVDWSKPKVFINCFDLCCLFMFDDWKQYSLSSDNFDQNNQIENQTHYFALMRSPCGVFLSNGTKWKVIAMWIRCYGTLSSRYWYWYLFWQQPSGSTVFCVHENVLSVFKLFELLRFESMGQWYQWVNYFCVATVLLISILSKKQTKTHIFQIFAFVMLNVCHSTHSNGKYAQFFCV